MTPYYSDDWLTVYQGDCREVMATMEPESVHCVVTSPPYFGLRDYGTATWIGGVADCPHNVAATGSTQNKGNNNREGAPFRRVCGVCGAQRIDGQIGLEASVDDYVSTMVDVFAAVRRVLRPDGTLWLNLGDSFAGSWGAQSRRVTDSDDKSWHGSQIKNHPKRASNTGSVRTAGLKPKDMYGVPWRVAFALQADGWYLRSDIIWSKPNPMPESVTDRPTKSHEYLFLLSKSARYYFDGPSVAEPAAYGNDLQSPYSPPGQQPHSGAVNDWQGKNRRPSKKRGEFDGKTEAMPGRNAFRAVTEFRNIRSVWTIATQPYPGAHFATFPPKLVEPCIKAGSPSGGVVLDPFGGSGTTGMVAQALGRRAVLIDLNGDYLVQAMRRNQQSPLGLDVA